MNACVLIGHKDCIIDNTAKLTKAIEKLIVNLNVNVFYVGTQGNFDRYVYRALCDLEKKYTIKTVVVLAYLNDKSNIYYDADKTIFPDCLSKVYRKYAIYHRNLYMINMCQHMICYVNNKYTNTYKFVDIAKKKGLNIVNIGTLNINTPDLI